MDFVDVFVYSPIMKSSVYKVMPCIFYDETDVHFRENLVPVKELQNKDMDIILIITIIVIS